MNKIKCKECKYCHELKVYRNTRSEYFCEHPNQKYINDYFEEKRMVKAPAFLAYGKSGEQVPVKTSPKWCPRKKGE